MSQAAFTFDARPSLEDALRTLTAQVTDEIGPSKKLRKFAVFVQHNLAVVALIERFACEAHASGRRHYGMKAIVERARWEASITTRSADWKFDNRHTAYLARLVVIRFPELRDLFELRRLHPEGARAA